ncbi:MAG: ABC transporter permease [Dehalococcoidia bacterium]
MVRLRAWLETILAILSVVALAAATLINPRWFEALFEASPDAGSGEFEWFIAIGLAIAMLCFGALARRDFRRLRDRARPCVHDRVSSQVSYRIATLPEP